MAIERNNKVQADLATKLAKMKAAKASKNFRAVERKYRKAKKNKVRMKQFLSAFAKTFQTTHRAWQKDGGRGQVLKTLSGVLSNEISSRKGGHIMVEKNVECRRAKRRVRAVLRYVFESSFGTFDAAGRKLIQ